MVDQLDINLKILVAIVAVNGIPFMFCTAYHSLYHNNYDPLPKFYKGTNYDKKKVTSQSYRQVNQNDKLNSDRINPDRTNPDGITLKTKTSAASKINIKNVKRVQQVCILKNPN